MLNLLYYYLLYFFTIFTVASQAGAARIMNGNPTKQDWVCKVDSDGQWDCQRVKKPKNVFNKELKPSQKEKALANDLSWVSKPSYMVGGYYNNDSQFTKALCKSKKTIISGESSQYDSDGNLIATGNVEFLQCDQELYADNAIVGFNPNGGSIKSLTIIGNVIMRQPSKGIIIRSKGIGANMDDGIYTAGPTYFRMAREVPDTRMYSKENFSGYLRGYAKTFVKRKTIFC